MTHTSGLAYGVLDPGTLMFRLYNEKRALNPATPLADMMETLAGLPLAYHPGESWEYSIATDVLGRLVEVLSKRFDEFLRERIFEPLGMSDTDFVAKDKARLATYYAGADIMAPMKPGLTRLDNHPYPGAFVTPVPRLSGGGGLVSSLADMIALVKSLMPGGDTLLKPQTLELMRTNQLAAGQCIRFPRMGDIPGKGFGLGSAVTLKPSAIEPRGLGGRARVGRHRRHALVDRAGREIRRHQHDAAPDGVLAPVRVRVQAARLRGGRLTRSYISCDSVGLRRRRMSSSRSAIESLMFGCAATT